MTKHSEGGPMQEVPEPKLFNVIARRLDDGTTRLMAENLTERNADAVVKMAVMRRGVDEECFYTETVGGTYE